VIQVQTEPLEPRQVRITVVVTPERIERAMSDVAQDLARRQRIAGYRPGKVPLRVAIARFGEEPIREQALERLTEQVVREAIRQEGIEPWAPAQAQVTQEDPFTVQATVPLAPQVELGDYTSLSVARPPVREVTDEDVENVIQALRQEHATLQTVDRPAQPGDTVVLSLVGTLADGSVMAHHDGLALDLSDEGARAGQLPPGIVEALEGTVAGETRTFSLTYSEFWPQAELQGREVSFEAGLEAVMARVAAPLDDQLARDAADLDSLDLLRERLGEQLRARAEMEAQEAQVTTLVDGLVASATVAYPPIALEREVASAFVDLRQRVERQGVAWERWLELQGLDEEKLWADIEPEAAEQLRRRLVLRAFVHAEKIGVKESELDAEVDRLRKPFGRSARRVLPPAPVLRRSAGSRILTNRAVERLLEISAANTLDGSAQHG
jgi:trigger factor